VQAKAALPGESPQRSQFFRRVAAAIFARLRDRHGVGLHLMHIIADGRDQRGDAFGRQLRAVAICQHQLSAVEEEAGRAALVHFDMRLTVAHHPAVGRAHRAKREAVRGCPRRHPQRRALAPEQRGKARVERGRQRIAIIGIVRLVGSAHRIPQPGVDGGGVVGQEGFCEAHRQPPLAASAGMTSGSRTA
jgi:hypothetical protein